MGGSQIPIYYGKKDRNALAKTVKSRPKAGLYMKSGETGIRTLGPAYAGQRFSRPPRSTAPASLQWSNHAILWAQI